jgi:hypothetical protein
MSHHRSKGRHAVAVVRIPAPKHWSQAMSWTVACFCGTVFEPPPDRCPTCHALVPGVNSTGRTNGAPQRPGDASPRDVHAEPLGVGSLERELSQLIAAAPAPADGRPRPPVDAHTPRTR